jgi:hypothetical protein
MRETPEEAGKTRGTTPAEIVKTVLLYVLIFILPLVFAVNSICGGCLW